VLAPEEDPRLPLGATAPLQKRRVARVQEEYIRRERDRVVREGRPLGSNGFVPLLSTSPLLCPQLVRHRPPWVYGVWPEFLSTGDGVDKWEESLRGGGAGCEQLRLCANASRWRARVGGCPINVATSHVWKCLRLLFAEINAHPLLS